MCGRTAYIVMSRAQEEAQKENMYVIACLLNRSLAQQVHKDVLVTDLLVLPPGTDLHDHHFVKNGIIL